MKLLITGACGFVGSALAASLLARLDGLSIVGIDNLMRPGSETNRLRLRALGVHFIYGDIRSASDVEALPAVDWVVDAAANPSVLAGVVCNGTSRQLLGSELNSLALAMVDELEALLSVRLLRAGVTEAMLATMA